MGGIIKQNNVLLVENHVYIITYQLTNLLKTLFEWKMFLKVNLMDYDFNFYYIEY